MRWLLLYALPVLLVVPVWWTWLGPALHREAAPLLVAPMMDLTPCLVPGVASQKPELANACLAQPSAAGWVHSTLAPLAQSAAPAGGTMELGYTLKVPLLHMVKKEGEGWVPDLAALERVARTLEDVGRPAVLYLFSTHFSVGAAAERDLFGDLENLAHTADGPLPMDRYFGHPVYPWSVARTDNAITQLREAVMDALAERICERPRALAQLRALTLLGEVHHLFPAFESGMGFGTDYKVTDYSVASRQAFRSYLATRFGTVQRLNDLLGTRFDAFTAIEPPGIGLSSSGLMPDLKALDSGSAGRLVVTGWAHVPGQRNTALVRILRNGELMAETRADLSRQDVLAARPDIGHADVGWRHDLDYRGWPPGRHRIDVLVHIGAGRWQPLGTRHVQVADKMGKFPVVNHAAVVPMVSVPNPVKLNGHLDEPPDDRLLNLNPLAIEWLAFRQQQVLDYLLHFSRRLERSCLGSVQRYTHQIVPHFNPGWDFEKYAVDLSLQPRNDWLVGVSLYGGTSYGPQWPAWQRQMGHTGYGVTEFHPLRPLSALELQQLLQRHRQDGARFLSFFLDTRFDGDRVTEANPFALEPDNTQFASDALAVSMRAVLKGRLAFPLLRSASQ